jgi:hypothetical protein
MSTVRRHQRWAHSVPLWLVAPNGHFEDVPLVLPSVLKICLGNWFSNKAFIIFWIFINILIMRNDNRKIHTIRKWFLFYFFEKFILKQNFEFWILKILKFWFFLKDNYRFILGKSLTFIVYWKDFSSFIALQLHEQTRGNSRVTPGFSLNGWQE